MNPSKPTRRLIAKQRLILDRLAAVDPPAPQLTPTIPVQTSVPIPSTTLPPEPPPVVPKPPSAER
jgi:hypothetical protein